MRTLAADLTTAQQAATHEPYVAVSVENSIAAIRRHDFAIIDQTANTIGKHDVAVIGNGSVIRVRSDNAGGILYQINATPGAGSGYSGAWTTLATGKGNNVAVCAIGTRVAIVYTDAGATNLKMRESTDSGATFAAETTPGGGLAAVVDLGAAYKNASGDMVIAYCSATLVGAIRRVAGAFGATSDSGNTFATVNGIAACYAGDYELVVTGTEVTTTAPTVWSLIYGDGFEVTAGAWGTLRVQVQAESDATIAYSSPSLCLTDTYRVIFLEADTFTGGNTRVYRSWLHPSISYASGPKVWRAQLPVNYGGSKGLAHAADASGGYIYEAAPDYVARAAKSAVITTLTTDVIAIDIREEQHATRGHIDLDNSSGLYAGPPAPLAIGNAVTVRWGYNTLSGQLSSAMQDLWIARTEHVRGGDRSTLRLHVEGVWEQLARARQHGHIVHTADTYRSVIARVLSRAGFSLGTGGASARSGATTPTFAIAADADAATSLRRALQFLADRLRPDTIGTMQLVEPLAADASTYTFGVAHPINEFRLVAAPPPTSESVALGNAAFGEAIDFTNAAAALGTREQQRDQSSATGAAAANTAAAHLRQRALDAPAGELVVPPHCGAELLDLIDLTDLYVSANAIKRRIAALHWRYNRHGGVYSQTLELGAA